MEGNPANFDAIGNRLGFRFVEDTGKVLKLVWHGPWFPAWLCLGITVLLLFVSIPIVDAIRLRGPVGPAASLWYFPVMNAVLFGIALYLLTLKRSIVFEHDAQRVTFKRESLFRQAKLSVAYSEIREVNLGFDQVYNGFAVAGSSAAQMFPVPSLRLSLANGDSVLLDRGSRAKLKEIGSRVSDVIEKTLEIDPHLKAA
jgi:hypothetical protein